MGQRAVNGRKATPRPFPLHNGDSTVGFVLQRTEDILRRVVQGRHSAQTALDNVQALFRGEVGHGPHPHPDSAVLLSERQAIKAVLLNL